MGLEENEVWITGLGLVSSLGEGCEEHWQRLGPGTSIKPVVENAAFSPYPVHPLVELDFSRQIPGRSDLRQMGKWQRLGTYTAGMALDDAGISGNEDLLEKTNMIVAAGGGERDLAVDTALLEVAGNPKDSEELRNQILMNDLRPTHFLSELSNLLAGNISIVHGVVGSSRTFMGEEMAGFSAVEIAAKRIQNQQGELFLVGGAYNAERQDMLLQFDLGQLLWAEAYEPLWARQSKGGGMVMGSVSAFVVLESKRHALARGAKPYAQLSAIQSGRSTRAENGAVHLARQQFEALGGNLPQGSLAVLSGACGVEVATRQEMAFIQNLGNSGYEVALRGYGNVFGHSVEAQFPAGLALACLAASKGTFFEPFDTSGVECEAPDEVSQIIVTTWGPFHGEGMALVEKVT
jgi:3-oxoacyl-[acyl-carrier-protein] synthase II